MIITKLFSKKLVINQKIVLVSIMAFALVVLTSVSYAYFLARVVGNETAKGVSAETGIMSLELDGTTIVGLDNAYPGATHTINFSVTNTGTLDATYAISLINVFNNFANINDLVYTLTSTNNGGSIQNQTAPIENSKIVSLVAIPPDTTQEYTLTLIFKETGTNQNANQGKEFSGKIQIIDAKENITISGTVSNYNEGDYIELHSEVMTSQIKDNKYSFVGIETGEHELYVKSARGEIKGQKTIQIAQAENASISSDGNSINVTSAANQISMDINVSNADIELNGNSVEESQLLRDKILANSNIQSLTPDYTRGEPYTLSYKEKVQKNANMGTSISSNISGNRALGTNYTFDKETGFYKLTNIVTDTSYTTSAIGKYTCNNNTGTNCTKMYKINTINESGASDNYEEITSTYTTELTSNANKLVGTGMSLNQSTGNFEITDTVSNVSYNNYEGYYTCNNTNNKCTTAYKIETVNGSSVTKSTKYTTKANYNYIRNANVYNRETDETTHYSGLYISSDNDGISYYYRGAIDNNYVNFAGKTWRIVRINGDNTIRLMAQNYIGQSVFNSFSTYNPKYVGYTYLDDEGNIKDSTMKLYLEDWYSKNLIAYDDYITQTIYCNDTNSADSNMPSTNRLLNHKPSLKCNNTVRTFGGPYKLKIGLITADELNMAGVINSGDVKIRSISSNYMYREGDYYTMSPNGYTESFGGVPYVYVYRGWWGSSDTRLMLLQVVNVNSSAYVYPVINLKTDTIVSGNGTQLSPYTISID